MRLGAVGRQHREGGHQPLRGHRVLRDPGLMGALERDEGEVGRVRAGRLRPRTRPTDEAAGRGADGQAAGAREELPA